MKSTNFPPRLTVLKVQAVADVLGLSPRNVQDLIDKKLLTGFRLSTSSQERRTTLGDLADYVKASGIRAYEDRLHYSYPEITDDPSKELVPTLQHQIDELTADLDGLRQRVQSLEAERR